MDDQVPGSTIAPEPTFDMNAAVNDISEGLGFVSEPNPASEPEPEIEAPAGTVPESKEEPAPEPTAPAPAGNPPPKTWRPEALAEWDKLTPTVQMEVLKREEDMFKGLEGYKAEATVGKEVKSIIAPYEQIFRDAGVNPMQTVSNLIRAHVILATGTPEQKAAMFQQIVTGYGLQDPSEAPYVDPSISVLQNKINQLESQLSGFTNQQKETQMQQTKATIDAFAADPANPYFDEVANDIAGLLRSGVAKDLKDAYDKAVWANPVTRAKELARLQTEKEAADRAEAEKKALEAKQASAANLKTSQKRANVSTVPGTMEDTMLQTLAKINARK